MHFESEGTSTRACSTCYESVFTAAVKDAAARAFTTEATP